MKLSPKQIAASCAGAVLSALIASFFGEKGTVIGVALGSAVATTTAALVAQSIERTHSAVKGVVVKAPRHAPLLRRFGATVSAGTVEAAAHESPVVEGEVASAAIGGAAGLQVEGPAASRTETTGPPAWPVTEPLSSVGGRVAGGGPPPAAPGRRGTADDEGEAIAGSGTKTDGRSGGIRWRTLVLATVAVFALTLLLVTVVELVAGRPLASLFGSSPATGGTSAASLFTPSPTTTTTTSTSTTTTTSTSTTTTTTTTTSSTTTTTLPTTTTTAPAVTTTSPTVTTTTAAAAAVFTPRRSGATGAGDG